MTLLTDRPRLYYGALIVRPHAPICLIFRRVHPQIDRANRGSPPREALRKDCKAMRLTLARTTVGTPLIDETERLCAGSPA